MDEFDMQAKIFGTSGPVPGSAREIAERKLKAEKAEIIKNGEQAMREMSGDFPQLARIYDALKGKAI